MSLKPLIKKQKLRIDDHKRGTGEIKDWNDSSADIHLDKETYYPIDGEIQNIRIKIPLNSNSNISIKNNKKATNEIPRKLLREIKGTLKNRKARQDFVADLVDTLKDYESALDNVENVQKSVAKIAKHFDLNWPDFDMRSVINDVLQKYTRYYTDEEGDKFFVSFDRDGITIGERLKDTEE